MANRIKSDQNAIVDKRDKFNTIAAVHLSSPGNQSRHIHNVDDVIVSLANSYENRRARQASEWERLGRQGLQLLV
jgi:hypothetical protein